MTAAKGNDEAVESALTDLSTPSRVQIWMADTFEGDLRDGVGCPQCRIPLYKVTDLVVHLNDGHKWTREQIASHLDAQQMNLRIRS